MKQVLTFASQMIGYMHVGSRKMLHKQIPRRTDCFSCLQESLTRSRIRKKKIEDILKSQKIDIVRSNVRV